MIKSRYISDDAARPIQYFGWKHCFSEYMKPHEITKWSTDSLEEDKICVDISALEAPGLVAALWQRDWLMLDLLTASASTVLCNLWFYKGVWNLDWPRTTTEAWLLTDISRSTMSVSNLMNPWSQMRRHGFRMQNLAISAQRLILYIWRGFIMSLSLIVEISPIAE